MADSDLKDTRLDKWLWSARFFKTRSLAQRAIEGGKVFVNGVRAKPSRVISAAQEIQLTTHQGQLVVIVEGISEQRGSATVAAKLYRETEDSKIQREKLTEMHRLSATIAPPERPNSKDRRSLRKLKDSI